MLALASLSSCGAAAIPNYDYAKEPDPRGNEFVIGVSDHLTLTVWKNPELSSSVVVRPDGTITLPLIGDMRAAGRSPSALRKAIQRRLSTYVKTDSAVITLAVTEVNSYHFTVTGEVARAGMFTSPRYVTLVEAIAMAGGFTRFAAADKMVVLRRGPNGQSRRIPIAYSAITSGRSPRMNLVVLRGDSIYVP